MVKHLRKVGNSTALLLDKLIFELLGITDQSAVQITVSNGSLFVTPMNPAPSQGEFDASVEHVMKRRRKLLQRLSQ